MFNLEPGISFHPFFKNVFLVVSECDSVADDVDDADNVNEDTLISYNNYNYFCFTRKFSKLIILLNKN